MIRQLARIALLMLPLHMGLAASEQASGAEAGDISATERSYRLGPNDQVIIRCPEIEDVAEKPTRIDGDGNISLPLLGRFRAAGLTIAELEKELKKRLREYIYEPQVSLVVSEYQSQPVSLLGAVQTAGTYQLQGKKTLIEVLSLAGGLRPDAGSPVTVTRRRESGDLPLPDAHPDATGSHLIATIDLSALLAGNPESNIILRPYDVVLVARAQLVYAIGEVRKPGGFMLTDGQDISALKVLSLAEGTLPTAAAKNAKILRLSATHGQREEIPLDLTRILSGKALDVIMQPEDILVVPTHKAKNAALRALDAVIQTGTGIAIYRR